MPVTLDLSGAEAEFAAAVERAWSALAAEVPTIASGVTFVGTKGGDWPKGEVAYYQASERAIWFNPRHASRGAIKRLKGRTPQFAVRHELGHHAQRLLGLPAGEAWADRFASDARFRAQQERRVRERRDLNS